jgi:predicted small integral membrane protein
MHVEETSRLIFFCCYLVLLECSEVMIWNEIAPTSEQNRHGAINLQTSEGEKYQPNK